MRLYLITTDHMERKVWFRETADYKAGMNYVAVTAFRTKVMIVAFILMSNHVHFLILGTCQDAQCFIRLFKQLYGTYYCRKYDTSRFMRRNKVDIREILLTDEAPERAVAYVQMNSVAARICLDASGYRWGTGSCFFNDFRPKWQQLGDMSLRAQRRLLKTHVTLPQNWLLSDDGYVLPESYVNIEYVENLFRTPPRMRYFLLNSSKAKLVAESTAPSFQDSVVLSAAKDLCRTLFHKSCPEELPAPEKAELIRQLNRRLSADIHQLSRVVGLQYQEISNILSSF